MYVPHVSVSLTRRITSSGSGLIGNDSQAQDQTNAPSSSSIIGTGSIHSQPTTSQDCSFFRRNHFMAAAKKVDVTRYL